jgi:hypothetical protein
MHESAVKDVRPGNEHPGVKSNLCGVEKTLADAGIIAPFRAARPKFEFTISKVCHVFF